MTAAHASQQQLPGPQPWDTYRTKCSRGRATYHPEWSESLPWALYVNGTATVHRGSLDAARAYFRERGMHLAV
jgi:hypothetical protein